MKGTDRRKAMSAYQSPDSSLPGRCVPFPKVTQLLLLRSLLWLQPLFRSGVVTAPLVAGPGYRITSPPFIFHLFNFPLITCLRVP